MKLEEVFKFETAKFIFRDLNGPNIFDFKNRNSVHPYNTRQVNDLVLPQPRNNLLLRSIFFSGIRFFNSLPVDIKVGTSDSVFKKRLKDYLMVGY